MTSDDKESHDFKMESAPSTSQETEINEASAVNARNGPQKFIRSSGFATASGQSYEWKICALLFLRGMRSGQVFELASNVADAGAMDDVIFRFKTREDPDKWITCFIQAKHKNKSTLTASQLISPKGKFSLPTYLVSYRKIKEEMAKKKQGLLDGNINNSWFIIFTNAKDKDDLGEGRDKAEGSFDSFIWANKGKIFSNSTERNGFATTINECLETKGTEGKEFLSRLKLYCAQPSEDQLDATIKDELGQSKEASNRSSDLSILFRFFMDGMKEWCETTGSAQVLHKGSDILQIANDRTLVEICSLCEGKMYQMPPEITYDEAVISALQAELKGFSLVHFIPSEPSFKLSCTKVIQAVKKGVYYFFGIESMIRYKQQVLDEWKKNKNQTKTLIIFINNTEEIDEEKTLSFFSEVCKYLPNPDDRIVLLADNDNSLVVKIGIDIKSEKHLTFKDSFQASQLEEKSLTYISSEISFKLQGYWTKLGNFPDMIRQTDSQNQNAATLCLDASLLVGIVENGPSFSVAAQPPEGITYYVARTMEQLTVLKRSDFFGVEVLKESVSVKHATIAYVRSILKESCKDSEMVNESLNKFSRSVLKQDVAGIFVGDEFQLGRFACNFIGFQSQYNQESPIPALRMQKVKQVKHTVTNENSSSKWFLFTFEFCTEQQEATLFHLHEVKHFLRLEKKLLTWTNSNGDIKVIRSHVDETEVIPTVNPETATCVDDRRLVLLCAEPGIGKSTLMTRMAKKTKEAHPNLWVISLSLNDHTPLFASGMHNNVFEFLLAASGIKEKSEVKLFKIALETTGNVVVLLDGYDEIAPKYITECCDLLTNIIKTKVHKIWITSRKSMKDILETHLSTLAANLRKFDEADQRRFLKQYWVDKSTMNESNLDVFISKLIKTTSQTLRDQEKDFMGIPLQTQIMAEVFEDFVTTPHGKEAAPLPLKLDLLELIEKFVDKKLVLYYQTKLNMNPDLAGYNRQVLTMDKKALYEGHKLAAIILVLSNDEIRQLHSKNILEDSEPFFKDIKSSEDKTGIIDGVINKKPRFVHRVFAEFFLAKWFAEHLKANVQFLREKLYTPEYAVILNFFDRILVKVLRLHTAVLDANAGEVEKLLNNGEDPTVKDEGGRTALHLAAHLGSSYNKLLDDGNLKIVMLLMKRSPENLEVEDTILFGKPLRYADVAEWWVVVDKMMGCADFEKYLVKTQLKINDGPILSAIVADDLVKLLNFCLERSLTINPRALTSACENGSGNVAEIFIARGVDFADF